ncbi:hypothetical protein HLRTI_002662 [Halorhabdus tiamatea SARL4B]|uniref:CRISPR-associated exonuclease Cas4 n=1 Tax=Halorhabdus tiamatea SARL4B TaxID=1033806 RepID=S6CU78_9EURY|nr:hypothetical protein [Halorhabdus tiamatea]ERJ05357.1 hypothetical protein HLRTI_002662 [Halorhabdus tiamatea SARL4B]CCQ33627.1 conserved hypothetical protein [Halorhabdus tiamatea SARL4B]
MPTFRELATAAYCPRKSYYRRQDATDVEVPPEVKTKRDLAFAYPRLLEADLSEEPIAVTPTQFRSRLSRVKASLDAWDGLVDPAGRDVLLEGRDCRGIAHKVLEEPVAPSLVFTGAPPETGVWEPQSVRLVAAALALAYEREREIPVAFAEYPVHGIVRRVPLSAHRRATYRSALRTLETLDGPPPRVANQNKCESCEYREECGVRTRSLRSLL